MVTSTDDQIMNEEYLRAALDSIRIKIGSAASAIVSAPEYNTLKLRELLKLLEITKFDVFNEKDHKNTIIAIHQLVASVACEVFKDIIPSYRVREGKTDENAKERKQTIQLRQFETTLLSLYKTYLQRLERMLESARKSQTSTFYTRLIQTDQNDRRSLAICALKCYSELIIEHPHFNFRDQILKKLVEFSSQSKCPDCSAIASDSLSKVLRQDKVGEISLEVTKILCDLVKARKLSLAPYVFYSLLNLNFIDVKAADNEIKAKKKAQAQKEAAMNKKLSRKERKHQNKMKKLKSDLVETEAHTSIDNKLKYHRLILKKLFVTYFRLLKYHEELDGEEKETQKFIKILPPVLDGIGLFSHLIDLTLCNDLFGFIRRLLHNPLVPTNCLLHCLRTVFVLYKSLESELSKVDPESFYKQFYVILANLKPYSLTQQEFESLVQCIDLIIIKRAKRITNQRYGAFVRRILLVALYAPREFSISLISMTRDMLLQHPTTIALLDSTNCSNYGSGLCDLECTDIDYSHADSSVAWEIHLLKRHHDASIRDCANHFLKDLLANYQNYN